MAGYFWKPPGRRRLFLQKRCWFPVLFLCFLCSIFLCFGVIRDYAVRGSGSVRNAVREEFIRELCRASLQIWSPVSSRFYLEKKHNRDRDPSYGEYLKQKQYSEESRNLFTVLGQNSRLYRDGAEWEIPEISGSGLNLKPAGSAAGEELFRSALRGREKENGTYYRAEKLADYDYLMKHFYIVHSTASAGRDLMQAPEFLRMDFSLSKEGRTEEGQEKEPQILIYHTHSQEEYADYHEGNTEATVVAVGAYLAGLLEEKGYRVYHDTSVYDRKGDVLDRSRAYNYALEGITAILQKYPSIQVILDLHRDGVSEATRLVSEVDGKPTASVMFFNGTSETPDGPIEYLPNRYRKENLGFSFQLKLCAEAIYPGFTRKIYLKGLRYNLHLRPRSALVEVGAQTNTSEEALNAMAPLAEILDLVLQER